MYLYRLPVIFPLVLSGEWEYDCDFSTESLLRRMEGVKVFMFYGKVDVIKHKTDVLNRCAETIRP